MTSLAGLFWLLATSNLHIVGYRQTPLPTELNVQDGNLGLVSLAVEARTKRAIQRLTQTYLTLSLQHIANIADLPSAEEAEQHVLQ